MLSLDLGGTVDGTSVDNSQICVGSTQQKICEEFGTECVSVTNPDRCDTGTFDKDQKQFIQQQIVQQDK